MRRLVVLAPLALAACADRESEAEPTPSPTVAQPRTLAAADLDLSTLGARIVGPQGPEVRTTLSAGNREIGKMVSFVACPVPEDIYTDAEEEWGACNPKSMPKGTVYTYVHQVTLAEADELNEQAAEGPEVLESPPTLFRMTGKAHGFNRAVGYSSAQALAALGGEDAISITSDDGHLIWRVVEGDGWKSGSTLTFWWQSTLPPAGPSDAYLLEIEGNQAIARGPFPAEEKLARAASAN